MTLRRKLLLAQAPLAVTLVLLGAFAVSTVTALGETSDRIIKDNYRSVLAAQRMKDSLERIDSAALFMALGERDKGLAQATRHRELFASELRTQEGNITEPGERDMTVRLREAWTSYSSAFERFSPSPSSAMYFTELEPTFLATKTAADDILALNQDAMVRKSEVAGKAARSKADLITWLSITALVIGLIASFSLTSRVLRPLDNLALVARRLGEGDASVRANVMGKDEIARVALEFNQMAQGLEAYRSSSLGELLYAQQASQAAIDSIPDPVIVFAVDGTVLSSNEAATSIIRPEASTTAVLAALEPRLRSTLERVRDHVLSGKGSYVPSGFEEAVAVAFPEGKRFLLPRGTPLYSEAKGVTGVTIVLQDITRLRRFEELRNNVVATVAHEFKTPLTSLRMALHLAVEGAIGDLTPKQLDILGAARDDCERLQTIVDDLLDLARFQAGKVELERRATAPSELVGEAIEALRSEAARRTIEVESHVTPSLDPVFADPTRMRLAFANLIANALRHTPAGGRVTISAEPADGTVRFSVADTGPGISREHQARIFERFYRIPGAQSDGAGLGLSIAREIVEAHGGEIGVVSEPGQGATFWFVVPIAVP